MTVLVNVTVLVQFENTSGTAKSLVNAGFEINCDYCDYSSLIYIYIYNNVYRKVYENKSVTVTKS